MKPVVSLRRALDDQGLLGPVLGGDSWATWRVVLLATMGEALTESEREVFCRVSGGRADPPSGQVEEALYLVGRRGGKDRAASVLATYIAGLCDHGDALSPGERGVVLCIAPDQRQAGITLDYIEAAFRGSPMLSTLVAERISDVLRLTSGIDIEVRAASFRRLRGMTCLAVVASEAAFWQSDETANADADILAAVRPALATTGGPLVLITTPYARRGEVWDIYRRYYGPDADPDILVVQGAAREFNPTLPQSVVDRALERDHAAGSAEYLAQFRADIESFICRESVEACVDVGVRERAPVAGVWYSAFTDPSGGSSDSMTLAVAHCEKDVAALDCVREIKPPFSPEAAVEEYAATLKSYGLSKVVGDRYGGEWPREVFRKQGISYEVSDKSKSDIYRNVLPLINSGRVRLLDHQRLVAQMCSLERRTGRGTGRDTIDHPPGQHDDVCNSALGALLDASTGARNREYSSLNWVSGPDDEPRYRDRRGVLRARRVGGYYFG